MSLDIAILIGAQTLTIRNHVKYVFKLGNSLISWNSKKQLTIELSTTEAEYMALSRATKGAIWLQQLLEELHIKIIIKPLKIICDNKGALKLAKN